MQIVIPLFDRFNVLDATGPYEVLRHLPDVDLYFSAERPGLIADVSRPCSLRAEAALADLPRPGVIVVPGGGGRKDHMHTGQLRDWSAMDELLEFGARPRRERYVFDGKYITAAGVSAGIDMSLALAAAIAGEEVSRSIQSAIEYDPHPPFAYQSPRLRSPPATCSPGPCGQRGHQQAGLGREVPVQHALCGRGQRTIAVPSGTGGSTCSR